MTYKEGFFKLTNRCNKNSTEDYGNIDKEVASEVVTKAINDWVRRQYHGGNQYREGVEESTMRVDDLQVLLVNKKLTLTNKGLFSDSIRLPSDYRYYSRFSFFDNSDDKCENIYVVYSKLREESNVDALLTNDGTIPSKDFEQSFHTIIGNKIRLYHNNEFDPQEAILTYYKTPKAYNAELENEVFEFADDKVELILDEAAKIITGDFDNFNQHQRLNKSVEDNN